MSDPKSVKPRWKKLTRRRFLLGTTAAALGAGAYTRWVEPFWPEFHEVNMPIPRLSQVFHGFRITHLTDLHVSDIVPMSYLREVVDRVNELGTDLIVITGDLVMHSDCRVDDAIDLISRLKVRKIVTFGNHDYDIFRPGQGRPSTGVADALQKGLEQIGCVVLRNGATTITHVGETFTVVGLEDLWSGLFDPARAFAGITPEQPVIALSHNPDTVPQLEPFKPGLILCGHTHGGQVRLPFFGPILLPVSHREWSQGYFRLKESRLYVSRAVGYLRKVRFCCRPEVPTFRLTTDGPPPRC